MSGFPIDNATSPALDLPTFASRVEPRRDDLFEQHLRRAEKPPASKKEERISKASGRSNPPEPRDADPAEPEMDRHECCSTKERDSVSQTSPDDEATSRSKNKDTDSLDEVATDEVETVLAASAPPVPQVNENLPALPEETAATLSALTDESLQDSIEGVSSTAIAQQTATEQAATAAQFPEANTGSQAPQDLADTSSVAANVDQAPALSDKDEANLTGAIEVDPLAEQAALTAAEAQTESPPEVSGGQTDSAATVSAQPATSGSSGDTSGRKEKTPGDTKTPEVGEPVSPSAATSGQTTAASAVAPVAPADTADDATRTKDNKSSLSAEIATAPASPDGVGTPQGRLPQHLLARVGEHAAAAKPLTEADQVRFVQRVARAFQTAANQDGELKLRLSPPELGSLRLEVKVLGGVMSARIETETGAARTLLLENLPALRERLAEQNIRVEHFDVDLMNHQGSGQPSGTPQDQNRNFPGSADGAARFSLAEEPREEPVAPRAPRRGGEGQLNILV